MNTPFKMKSSIARLMKNSPAKQEKLVGTKKLTVREQKIANNKEFNNVARKDGILPTFKTTKEKEQWYSNKSNVNMLNTKQKEYFQNKK
tara:strand:+ start:81 stop:347 length:267 start_codon:yes stop_codon:yes gene_type:complete